MDRRAEGNVRQRGRLAAGTAETYRRLGEVDSLVIDPHKHGLQPYGCG